MDEMKTTKKRDALAAVLTVLTAYTTSQAALIILQQTGTIRWHWAAVLTPTWLIGGLFLAIIIAGTIVGIRDYKRARAFKRATDEMRQDVRIPVDEILKSLAEEEDEEEIDE